MITIKQLIDMAGTDIGTSDWLTIDQDRINQFAEVTEDHQFIHVDEKRAAEDSPFGGTIAHGFLTLSLLSHLVVQVLPTIKDKVLTINYGLNKVRFLNPVRSGKRVRVHVRVISVVEKQPGRYMNTFVSKIEIEGEETPALVAEQVALYLMKSTD